MIAKVVMRQAGKWNSQTGRQGNEGENRGSSRDAVYCTWRLGIYMC